MQSWDASDDLPVIVTTGFIPVVPSGGEMDCRDRPGNDDSAKVVRRVRAPIRQPERGPYNPFR